MMRDCSILAPRTLALLASLTLAPGAFLAGCGDDDEPGSSAGSGGESTGGMGGMGGMAGGDSCGTDGSGTLTVTIDAPDEIAADVTVRGPDDQDDFSATDTIEVGAGLHTLEARRVTTAGDIVGKAYSPTPDYDSVCVSPDDAAELSVEYALEPGSEKLWVLTGDAAHTAAIDATELVSSAFVTPSVSISKDVTAANALAFDPFGNLWVADSDELLMYERDALGSASLTSPTLRITGDAVCEPKILPCGAASLAFDESGDLWVSLRSSVNRIAAADLVVGGAPTPIAVLDSSDLDAPGALAFDADGNLWVANVGDGQILKFSPEHLEDDYSGPADGKLSGEQGPPVVIGLGHAESLAFDADGNLWAAHYGPNVLARYTPEDRETGGVIVPEVQLGVGVLALLHGIAFDDGGNLWVTGKTGQIARIAKDQLVADGDVTLDSVLLDSDAFGSTKGLAFNPPGAGTPLAR